MQNLIDQSFEISTIITLILSMGNWGLRKLSNIPKSPLLISHSQESKVSLSDSKSLSFVLCTRTWQQQLFLCVLPIHPKYYLHLIFLKYQFDCDILLLTVALHYLPRTVKALPFSSWYDRIVLGSSYKFLTRTGKSHIAQVLVSFILVGNDIFRLQYES